MKTGLTDAFLRRKTIDDGLHGDGGGLYLRVRGDSRNFVFTLSHTAPGESRKKHRVGLGAYPAASLADAREKAKEMRDLAGEAAVRLRLDRGERFSDIEDEFDEAAHAGSSRTAGQRNHHQ